MDAYNSGGGIEALLAFIHPDAVTYPFPECPEASKMVGRQ
jgi:hypothetical protein